MSKSTRTAPKYLAFVRAHACCACVHGTPIEAHHFGPRGVGLKADDFHAVPLCARCHRAFHDRGSLPNLTRTETERDFWRAQSVLHVEWIRRDRDDGDAF